MTELKCPVCGAKEPTYCIGGQRLLWWWCSRCLYSGDELAGVTYPGEPWWRALRWLRRLFAGGVK